MTWLLQTALETAAAVWLHFPRRGSMLIALAEGLGEVPKQPWTQILLTSWSYLFSSTSFSSSRSLSRLPLSSPPNSVILSVSARLSRLDFSLSGCSAPVGNWEHVLFAVFFSVSFRQRPTPAKDQRASPLLNL